MSAREFLEAGHLFFDFCELLCGGWCCWSSVYWLGFFDRRGWRGWGLIGLGFILLSTVASDDVL